MKRYKLVKDLPTFKAGEVFYINEFGHLHRESDKIRAYSWSTIDKFPNILTDWFEEIKEPTRWKPGLGCKYYLSDSNGSVYDSVWSNDYIDRNRFEIGNCFKTREEAEQVLEYLKALATVRGDATRKFSEDDSNYYVYFDTEYKSLSVGYSWACIKNGVFGLPYFATIEDARRSIELHKKEWLTIFGAEEEE